VRQHACRTSAEIEYSFNSYSRMSCTASNGTCAAGLLAVVFTFLERLISLLNEKVTLTRFTSGVSRHHRAQYSTSLVTHVTQEILSQRHYIYKAVALQGMITLKYMLLLPAAFFVKSSGVSADVCSISMSASMLYRSVAQQ
jgi:hypothetical protein